MTDEQKLLEKLTEIHNEWIKLPIQHSSERQEWVISFHRLQHILMARLARKSYPIIFKDESIEFNPLRSDKADINKGIKIIKKGQGNYLTNEIEVGDEIDLGYENKIKDIKPEELNPEITSIKPDDCNLPKPEKEPCLHERCQECYGTGKKTDDSPCVHFISCPCPKCSTRC